MKSPQVPHALRVKKSTFNLAKWTVAWLLATALSTFGPIFLWKGNTPLTSISIGLTVLIGLGMVMSNVRYLNAIDELQRKIHLDAMAIALGISVIFGLGYSQLDIANVISFDAEIAHMVMFLGITYLVVFARGIIKMS